MKKENKNNNNKKISIDDLAVMIGKGFEEVGKKFQEVDKRFEEIDKKFELVDKRFDSLEEIMLRKIDGLSNRIDDLALNRATREEVKILEIRLEKIEKKVFK